MLKDFIDMIPKRYKQRSVLTITVAALGVYLVGVHFFWSKEVVSYSPHFTLPAWALPVYWVLECLLYFASFYGLLICTLALLWVSLVARFFWKDAWHTKIHVTRGRLRTIEKRHDSVRAKLVQALNGVRLWLFSGTWLVTTSEIYHALQGQMVWIPPLEKEYFGLILLDWIPFLLFLLLGIRYWLSPLNQTSKEMHDYFLGNNTVLDEST